VNTTQCPETRRDVRFFCTFFQPALHLPQFLIVVMKTYLSLKTYPSLLTQRALLPPSATAQQPREQQRRRFHRGGVWRVALRDAAAHGQKLLRARDAVAIVLRERLREPPPQQRRLPEDLTQEERVEQRGVPPARPAVSGRRARGGRRPRCRARTRRLCWATPCAQRRPRARPAPRRPASLPPARSPLVSP
jgi:hypothetical protein